MAFLDPIEMSKISNAYGKEKEKNITRSPVCIIRLCNEDQKQLGPDLVEIYGYGTYAISTSNPSCIMKAVAFQNGPRLFLRIHSNSVTNK